MKDYERIDELEQEVEKLKKIITALVHAFDNYISSQYRINENILNLIEKTSGVLLASEPKDIITKTELL